jgi:hypothetical protein
MGVLRLRRIAFAPMPSRVATAITIVGLFVVVFAVYLLRSGGAEREPLMTLQPQTSASAVAETGNVGVRVVTMKGDPVPDVPVELQSGFTGEAKKLTGFTDDRGRFTFRRVAIDPGSPWIAVATYDDADFTSDLLRTPGNVTIAVAPTTKSDAALSADIASLALVGDERGMQALQVVAMRNRSDEASVAGILFPILRGGTELDPGPGLDRASLLVDKRGNMVSIAPLVPGRSQFSYTYVAPMQRRGQAVSLKAPYTTRRFDLLVGGKLDFRPKSGLHRRGSVELGGRTYRRYTAENVRKGQALRGTVVLLSGSKVIAIALVALAVLIALAILLVPMLRRRQKMPEPAAPQREPQPEWT